MLRQRFLQTPAGDIASNPAKAHQFTLYAKLHAHLHSQSHFPVSLSSWKTCCDIKLVKAYLNSKTQGWFQRWGRDEPAVAPAAPPAPGAGAGGAGAPPRALPPTLPGSYDAVAGGGPGRGGHWRRTDWDSQSSTSPVWMRQTQRTGQALLRRTADHRH